MSPRCGAGIERQVPSKAEQAGVFSAGGLRCGGLAEASWSDPTSPPSDGAPLSLADAEQIALARNPALRQAAAQVQAARGRWVQAGLYPNPVVGYSASEIGNEGRAGQQGGFVGQEFITAGKLRLDRAVASQGIRQAEQQLAAQQYRVINDVRARFYEALAAERTVEIAEQLLDIGQQGLETAESLFRAEEVSRIDVLQAGIELDAARIVLSNARNRRHAAWRRLSAVMGEPALVPMPLAGDLEALPPDIDWHDALARLLAESPELAAARAQVGRARWVLERASVEPIPNFDVQGTAQYDDSSGSTIAGAQIGMALPIFNRNQGAIRQARAELTAARQNLARTELALQDRLAVALERYSNARQQVETYSQSILPSARSSLELTTSLYRQGEIGYLALLTAQRTMFQTNLAYLAAVTDLRRSTIAIDGLLLGDSLSESSQEER